MRRLPSGRYQARYPDGQGQDRPAPQTFATKADASAFLARVQAEMQKGKWRDPALGQVTFRSWAEQWLTANPAKRATSLARDRVVLKAHFLPQLGDRTLGAITRAHVKVCVDAMTAKLAPTTVRTNPRSPQRRPERRCGRRPDRPLPRQRHPPVGRAPP